MKVRGFRIELGEMEAALRRTRRCARPWCWRVRTPPAAGAGGVRGDGARGGLGGRAAAHLKARLPEYMVPSAFDVLEALPLTPNGKVDRGARRLPLERGSEGAGRAAHAGEEVLAGIFAEVLGWSGWESRTASSSWAATRCWRPR